MLSRRFTVLIADRTSGVVRRATVSFRAVAIGATTVLVLPVLIGLGAKWSARLRDRPAADGKERARRSRTATSAQTTGELTTQIQSLEGVIDELGARSALDPAQARAMAKLPAVVKARAAGGTSQTNAAISNVISTSLTSPEDTFGVLRTLLQGLESRLRNVRQDVERQEALAAATPSIWPAHGWLTGTFGGRSDPFTGEPRLPSGARHLDRQRAAGLTRRPTARVESAVVHGRLRQPDRASPRLRAVDALRASERLQRQAGPDRAPRRRHRLRRLDRPLDRRAPPLRDSRQRQADQPAAAPHAARAAR